MESLYENKPLLYSLMTSGGVLVCLACGVLPDLSAQFELVEFDTDFRNVLITVLAADFFGAFTIDRILQFIFCSGKGRLK